MDREWLEFWVIVLSGVVLLNIMFTLMLAPGVLGLGPDQSAEEACSPTPIQDPHVEAVVKTGALFSGFSGQEWVRLAHNDTHVFIERSGVIEANSSAYEVTTNETVMEVMGRHRTVRLDHATETASLPFFFIQFDREVVYCTGGERPFTPVGEEDFSS